MTNYLDIEKLAHLVRSKRGRRGLRETAQAIGNVSPSTISRVENGKTPDMETFLALCDWLEVPPAELIKNTDLEKENETASNPSEALANWFRSDKNLDPAIAQVLASFIKVAYHDLSDRGKSDES
jgi:transcriptional regulator with XRE-family HTH domain